MKKIHLSRGELRAALARRAPADHKGKFGHALIIAGSRGMAGAAILSGRAALRSGSGLVTLAVPAGIAAAVAGAAPCAMTLALPENKQGVFQAKSYERLESYARSHHVTTMAIGPGLTTDPDTAKFVRTTVSNLSLPLVIDADALNILAQDALEAARRLRMRGAPYILTPHPGEAARLLETTTDKIQSQREESARRLVETFGGVAVLKGRKTLVGSRLRLIANQTGGHGLAKGGTGDVLTGLIAGLWAQNREADPVVIAAAAAWIHGRAGDIAQNVLTAQAMCAEDVISYLPRAFKSLCN